MDNCGSFDKLIPLLPKEFSYLVFDLPGHGLSSKYPEGMIYSYYDTVVLIERIRREYKWDKLSYIGHSLGGLCGFFYASIFPDYMDLFVALDSFEPYIVDPVLLMRLNVSRFFDYYDEHRSEPPSYGYEALLDKIEKGSHYSIDLENAKHLLVRSVKKSTKYPGKYFFNYDHRLKAFDRVSRQPEDLLHFAKNITVPVLYLMGEGSFLRKVNYEKTSPVRDYLLANHPGFTVSFGPGTHHFHLTHPEAYADRIGQFIRKNRRPVEIECKAKL